jgi:NitT/TauT family transport system substrate-binding protein
MKRLIKGPMATLATLVMVIAACGGDSTTTTTGAPDVETTTTGATDAGGELTPVRLQLQWFPQSQFAGYFAAKDLGFYEEVGLDVSILSGAVDIVPQQVVATGGAEFGLAWVPKALESNESGTGLVNIAQVFQRSGTLQVAFKDSGIASVEDFRGQRIGTWGFGNEHEVIAAIRQAGMDPDTDVTLVNQGFDMLQLLPEAAGGTAEVDAAEAMIYNEYAQVLETINPETGELYTADDLNIIDYNQVGTAMLQDAVWASADWLAQNGNEDVAIRFLEASFRGWIYCRDNFDSCVDIVLQNGPQLPAGHQSWQLNEINALIWPSPAGIGIMDPGLWNQTVEVATSQEIIGEAPDDSVYRTDLAQAAIDRLSEAGEDVNGEGFEKITVELEEGGA